MRSAIAFACGATFAPASTQGAPAVAIDPAADVVAPPLLSKVRQSHRVWQASGRTAPPSVSRHTPVGTTFSFTVNEPAQVILTFTRRLVVGALSVKAHRGHNRISFAGVIPHARRLAPGRYAVTILAANIAGRRSAPRTLNFTIIK